MQPCLSTATKLTKLPNIELDSPWLKAECQDRANRLIKFIDSSPEPFHVVNTVAQMLISKGFVPLVENENWSKKLVKGGKYFFTRNGSSIVAFIVGGRYLPGCGFKVIGAHTDRYPTPSTSSLIEIVRPQP